MRFETRARLDRLPSADGFVRAEQQIDRGGVPLRGRGTRAQPSTTFGPRRRRRVRTQRAVRWRPPPQLPRRLSTSETMAALTSCPRLSRDRQAQRDSGSARRSRNAVIVGRSAGCRRLPWPDFASRRAHWCGTQGADHHVAGTRRYSHVAASGEGATFGLETDQRRDNLRHRLPNPRRSAAS